MFFRRCLFSLLVLFSAMWLKAQVDTNFIQTFPDKLTISTYLGTSTASLQFIPRPLAGDTLQHSMFYQPNLRGGFGLSVSYKIIDFSLGMRSKLDPATEKLYGKTYYKMFSFRLWATRKVAFELKHQRMHGFSNRNYGAYDGDTIPYSPETPFEPRPDIRIQYYKVRALYQHNPHKFSYRAAFSLSERQRKSKGGLLFNSHLYRMRVAADSSFAPEIIREDYGKYRDLKEVSIWAFGLAPGIGGTLSRGRWFITGVIFVGMDFQHFKYEEGVDQRHSEWKLSQMLDLRISMGYNNRRFFFAWENTFDYNLLNPTAFRLNTIFGRSFITMGYRFDSPRILNETYRFLTNRFVPEKYRPYVD